MFLNMMNNSLRYLVYLIIKTIPRFFKLNKRNTMSQSQLHCMKRTPLTLHQKNFAFPPIWEKLYVQMLQ